MIMDIKEVQKEIADLTERLRKEKPEVYKLLMENPQTLLSEKDRAFEESMMKYKNNLLELLNKK